MSNAITLDNDSSAKNEAIELLGLLKGATKGEINEAHEQLSKANATNAGLLKMINKAYTLLTNEIAIIKPPS